ncbi:putative duf1941 family protein [Rosellinia necatrix]|uniref:Putative duf1941 family protein n=1 Tax=Rosellinia necatrix TaxID=77044 RepID=A0A1W2TRP5_ROSNE|nr:putative duf1941 family protein [Rosellinia necatrix]
MIVLCTKSSMQEYQIWLMLFSIGLEHPPYISLVPLTHALILVSSEQTTQRIVDLIHILVQQPDGQAAGGATCFAELDINSWAPLIEIAPQHKPVFSIFHWVWVKGSSTVPPEDMNAKIDKALQLFISAFTRHNPTPLLDFVALILDSLSPNLRPLDPSWLRSVAKLIHNIASSKQTQDGRRAFTHCAAALLAAYPDQAPGPLFSDDPDAPKPIAYLFIKMIQVDILATLHILMEKLSTPEYPSLSRRIAAALDTMTSFVGFLIAAADDITVQQSLTPDRIIKLHEDLVRTIGDVMEYLRDRWDGFLAGTRGIESTQASGRGIFEDPITPAAVRFVATWLRDDDGESTRTQAGGLVELFAELYKMNLTSEDMPELRLPILAALEGVLQTSDGLEAFNNTDLLQRGLYPDVRRILAGRDADLTTSDYMRGSAIVQVFHILIEHDKNLRSHAGSADILDLISKCDVRPIQGEATSLDRLRLDFQTDVLELAATLLSASGRDITPALQQKIKHALGNISTKVTGNWRILDDEDMVVRMAELRFE